MASQSHKQKFGIGKADNRMNEKKEIQSVVKFLSICFVIVWEEALASSWLLCPVLWSSSSFLLLLLLPTGWAGPGPDTAQWMIYFCTYPNKITVRIESCLRFCVCVCVCVCVCHRSEPARWMKMGMQGRKGVWMMLLLAAWCVTTEVGSASPGRPSKLQAVVAVSDDLICGNWLVKVKVCIRAFQTTQKREGGSFCLLGPNFLDTRSHRRSVTTYQYFFPTANIIWSKNSCSPSFLPYRPSPSKLQPHNWVEFEWKSFF